MTAFALLLVVIAAFVHATWNLLAKQASSVGPVFVFSYNIVACVAYLPWVGSDSGEEGRVELAGSGPHRGFRVDPSLL